MANWEQVQNPQFTKGYFTQGPKMQQLGIYSPIHQGGIPARYHPPITEHEAEHYYAHAELFAEPLKEPPKKKEMTIWDAIDNLQAAMEATRLP